jgi:hypothetical protein
MAARLIAVLERLPPLVRRGLVGATAVLLVAFAITALTLEPPPETAVVRSTGTTPVRAVRRVLPGTVSPNVRRPVSSTELGRAARAARRFLRSYLRFAYGGSSARSVKPVAPGLRRALLDGRGGVAPAERHRRPHIVSLQTVATATGFAVATATVDDGGAVAYQLRFSLRDRADRWSVSDRQAR